MPTVATQTGWSWLSDLKAVEALVGSSKVELSFSFNSDIDNKEENASITTDIQDFPQPSVDLLNSGATKDLEKAKQNEPNRLVLPPLVPIQPSSSSQPKNDHAKSKTSPKEDKLPPIFTQLEEISFSEQETDGQSTSDESEDENTSNREHNDADSEKYLEKYSKLSAAGKQPGIAIIKYVSESESMYYNYFSMENKVKVENRISKIRNKSPGGDGSDNRNDIVQKDLNLCQFCGREVLKMSLLEVIRSQEGDTDDNKDVFCCDSYREYQLLVAMCMRRMVEEARNPPKLKKPKPKKKIDKKALEEKALAIARRKQKWEEMQEKKRLEAEALRRQRKGLETIKFSLLDSEVVVEKGWGMRPESRVVVEDIKASKRKRRESRPKKEEVATPQEMFQVETIERLQLHAQTSGQLSITTNARFLPDGTGFCRYPSGHLAVVVASPYNGALSYLVYEDSQYPQILCSFDELGRACSYHQDGTIQFISTQTFMGEYDFTGRTEKTIIGGGPTHNSLYYKTRTMKLNKHMVLKCSPGTSRLTVNFPHSQLKFIASCKLHKDEIPAYVSELHSETTRLELYLASMRERIEEVKKHLPSTKPRVARLLPRHGSPLGRRSRQRFHLVSSHK